MRFLWQAWQAYAHRAGQYQSRVLLTLVYVVLVGPVAAIARVMGRRLVDQTGSWQAREVPDPSLASMRRQF